MGIRRRLFVVLIFVGFGTAACKVSTVAPADAKMSCARDADCPAPFTCSSNIKRCVAAGADEEPPKLASATLAPTVVRAAEPFRVAFTVSEPLAEEPRVELGLSQRLALHLVANDGLTYTYEGTPSGSEPEGVWNVLASLVDAAGNRADDLVVGALALDFHAPIVTTANLQYLPASANVLAAPSAATDGTLVTVTFTANEPAQASLQAGCATPITLELRPPAVAAMSGLETYFVFEYRVSADTPVQAEKCALVASLTDGAGNTEQRTLPDLLVAFDRVAPSAADIDASVVKHLRIPFGSAQADVGQYLVAQSLASTQAPASDCATAAPACIAATLFNASEVVLGRVYSGDAATSFEGTIARGATGWRPLHLAFRDADALWLRAVDAAGNESVPVRVRNVEWVGTLGHKIAGDGLNNPMRLGMRRSDQGGLVQGDETEADDAFAPGAWLSRVGDAPLSTYGARSWQDRSAADPFRALTGAFGAGDSWHGGVIVGGGAYGIMQTNPTAWRWRGHRWQSVLASAPPLFEGTAAAAFDSRRGELLAFGKPTAPTCGSSAADMCSPLWRLTTEAWAPACTSADGPSCTAGLVARDNPAVAFDSHRQRLVVFGGKVATGVCEGNGDTMCNYTWAWDGTRFSLAATAGPPGRYDGAMTYDPHRDVVVLFGGITSPGTCDDSASPYCDTVWEWNGVSWANKTPATRPSPWPSGRRKPGLAYSPALQAVVLFGGDNGGSPPPWCDGQAFCGTTWAWDGVTWSKITTATSPAPRTSAVLASDPASSDVVLIGGSNTCGAACPGDCDVNILLSAYACRSVWAFDGQDWRRLAPRDPEGDGDPSARSDHVLADEASRGRVLLAGGEGATWLQPAGDQTWEWNGSSWERRCNGSPVSDVCSAQPSVMGPAAAVEPTTGNILLLGGYESLSYSNSIWSWNGSDWSRPCASPPCGAQWPSARYDASATLFDDGVPAHTGVLLAGGFSSPICSNAISGYACDDWWRYSAGVFTKLGDSSGGIGPGGRRSPVFIAHGGRHVAVLFGGSQYQTTADYASTWIWDGAAFNEQTATATDPVPRDGAAATYDADWHAVLMHGGGLPDGTLWQWDGGWTPVAIADPEGDGSPSPRRFGAMAYDSTRHDTVLFGGGGFADTWVLTSGVGTAPAQVFTVPLRQVGIDPTLVTELDVRWRAGGHGHAPSGPADGAVLSAWMDGAWQSVDSGAYGPSTPGELSFVATGASVTRLPAGAGDILAFAARPAGVNDVGTALAEVATDYVEIRVHYTVP